MNRSILILLGVLCTIGFSMTGIIIVPNAAVRKLTPYTDDNGNAHPVEPYGLAKQGRAVYIDLGCLYCHSQQIRPAFFGSDIERGWGNRRTVGRDYLYDDPPLLGSMRTGPDLTNIGARQPSVAWHYLHLYNPQITSPGSIMPRFPFLFTKVKEKMASPPEYAIPLPGQWSAEASYIVPNERARQLVEYLKSLDHTYELPEAK